MKEISERLYFEILESTLNYINEVSMGKYVSTAKKVAPIRAEQFKASKNMANYIKNNTSDNIQDYIKPDRELTKKGTKRTRFKDSDYDYNTYQQSQNNIHKISDIVDKAKKRAEKAKNIATSGLSDKSKINANKVFNAARNVVDGRYSILKANKSIPKISDRAYNRVQHANSIKNLDPNKKVKDTKLDKARKAVRKIEDLVRDTEKKILNKKNIKNLEDLSKYKVVAKNMEKSFRDIKSSKQAKTDHENAQIDQYKKKLLNKNTHEDEN